jgi:hypothetical protein
MGVEITGDGVSPTWIPRPWVATCSVVASDVIKTVDWWAEQPVVATAITSEPPASRTAASSAGSSTCQPSGPLSPPKTTRSASWARNSRYLAAMTSALKPPFEGTTAMRWFSRAGTNASSSTFTIGKFAVGSANLL